MPREPIDITKLKPSELLRLAVQDAQKCEAMPEVYELRMGLWHEPQPSVGACVVCMAGAVMAQTLRRDPFQSWEPRDYGREQWAAFSRIDEMRTGVSTTDRDEPAMRLIHASVDPELRRAPWPVYLEAADMLEKAGL